MTIGGWGFQNECAICEELRRRFMSNRFNFGQNWQRYVSRNLDDERIKIAEKSLQDAFKVDSFTGKSFLDIGCGSGLYSLAAARLGADEIRSFDYDENAVEATRSLKQRTDMGDLWTITQGDILDDDFVRNLSTYDYVYAWGVLHHTGELYSAIENTLDCVSENGKLYTAIYNDSDAGRFSSDDWLQIKQRYANAGVLGKRIMEALYVIYWMGIRLFRGENPIQKIRDYKYDGGHSGMAFYPDVRDWLGGLPYEYATTDEVINYVTGSNEFKLLNVEENSGTGNNRFLFSRVN